MPRPRPLLLVAALGALSACSSLSKEDEIRLSTFKYNSKKFLEAEQFERAENACRRGLELSPDDYSLNLALGYTLLQRGEPTHIGEAIAAFERCLEVEDDFDYRCRLGLGEAQFQMGLLWANQILAADADERLTPEERADRIADSERGRDAAYAASEEALLEALESPEGRDNVVAQSTLARLYSILGRYDEASEVLRRMCATLATSLRVRQEVDLETIPEERRPLWERMVTQLEGQLAEGLGLLAAVAAKLERWDEVISVYARLESNDQMQPADYYNRARAHEALRSRDAAIRDYETFYRQAAGKGSAFTDTVRVAMRRAAELRDGDDFAVNP